MKTSIKTLFYLISGVVLLATFQGCGDSESFNTATKIVSSTITAGASRRAATCPSGSTCLNPTNLEGRIYAGSLMVGSGTTGYAVTTIGSDEARERPDLGKGGTQTFNISSAEDISGSYTCCGGSPYPDDSEATVERLEFLFDYVDTTFQVPTDAQAGVNVADSIEGKTFTIRVVFVNEGTISDVVDGQETTVQMGDKLVTEVTSSRSASFRFCDGTSDCTLTTRPSNVLQDSEVANFETPSEGNQNYNTFAISLTQGVGFTQTEALQGNWRFTVDFDLSNSVVLGVSSWSNISNLWDLVNAFQLNGRPSSSDQTSVVVSLSKEQIS